MKFTSTLTKSPDGGSTPSPSLGITIRGRKFLLSHDRAFSYGHTLLRTGHPGEAAEIFAALTRVRSNNRPARLMLARCKAAQEHYGACLDLLSAIFDGQDEAPTIVSELQAAFVFRQLGMLDDAAHEMSRVVKEHRDLPTACLLLGDMLAAEGKHYSAAMCWRLAIGRDKQGAVGLTARKQLRSLAKQLGRNAFLGPRGNLVLGKGRNPTGRESRNARQR